MDNVESSCTQKKENEDFLNSINEILQLESKLDNESKYILLPYLFLDIFVKFQNFLYDIFKKYCMGGMSSMDYAPSLNHVFKTENEFNDFLLNKNKDFMGFDDKINTLSKYIFKENIFDKLNYLHPLSYSFLKHIRNHIAHSNESTRKKLISNKIITNNTNLSDYFQHNSSGSKTTNFKKIIESLIDFSNYIIYPLSI